MSQVYQVNGDYLLKAGSGGTITLDTGNKEGLVLITGDLTVKGNTTTISTVNLDVEDNIIVLNFGESGAGITQIFSGIEIDRGSETNVRLLFNEALQWYNPISGQTETGSWTFTDTNNSLRPIRVASISSSELTDIVFDLRNTGNVLSVANSNPLVYSFNVLNDIDGSDNKIPTVRTMRDYVSAGGITSGMADVDKIYKISGATIVSRIQAYDDRIDLFLNEQVEASLNNQRLTLAKDLAVNGGDITTTSTTATLFNTAATTVNIGWDAISIGIGSTVGTTTVRHNLAVNGTSITTNSTSFSLLNGSATSINAFGAATSIVLGSATGLTTINHNLEINGGTVSTTATTFNLLNATATTVNFAGAATNITIGATSGTATVRNANVVLSGDLAVNGGDITTTATTFNLLNATATTVNFAGAATTVVIGSPVGVTTVNNDLEVHGGDITSTQSTFNLLNTDVSTVNFAGDASLISIGSETSTTKINSDLDVVGNAIIHSSGDSSAGSISTNASVFNLINTVADEINIGSEATVINIGQSSGSTTINEINITGNIISSTSSDDILIDGVLSLSNQTVVPDVSPGYVKVYSTNEPGPGGTGLYFVNTIGTNDELISKTKAFLYSLIL
jgi:hypothetical protein